MYLRIPSIAISEKQLNALSDLQKLAQARADMKAKFDETLSLLDRAGLRVLVLPPNPEMIYPPRQCIGLRKGSYCDVPRVVNEKFLGDTTVVLEEVVTRYPNVRLARLMDFFCDAQTCFAAREGKILAYDENHITASAARDLGRFLATDLRWLLGESTVAESVRQH